MNAREAREAGERIAAVVRAGQSGKAYALLAPILAQRTPFRLLDLIGAAAGRAPLTSVNAFLDCIAVERTEGGWVVIASALAAQLGRDPDGAFARCRRYIAAGDAWYVPDIIGERVPGPALLDDFEGTLDRLAPWRGDENRWVRRTVGVAVHFWAKRTRGDAEAMPQARALLAFLEPLFTEQDLDAAKGAGWALKTLGRYYPDVLVEWLGPQLIRHRGAYRAVMLRKALTYLSPAERARVTKGPG